MSKPITPADIARLRELNEKRTPGAWEHSFELVYTVPSRGANPLRLAECGEDDHLDSTQHCANADFIAACSELVGSVLDRLSELEALVSVLQDFHPRELEACSAVARGRETDD